MSNTVAVPFLLAPMAELSHRALRELIESFRVSAGGICGANEYFTEMISAGAFVTGGPFEAWYEDPGPCPEKLVYQLVGGDADQLVKAAGLLGRNECLGIDLNMGCSAPAITRTGAGVSWMTDIDRAGNLIRSLRPAIRRRLSVKLRTGPGDDFDYLLHFCRRLESEGVELIILHPRTAREKFKRRARWNYVSALKAELHIPVAGNGDIASAEEMLLRGRECDAVMTGRLAVRRPWVFAEARALGETGESPFPKKPETGFLEETGLKFLELLSRYQPPEFHLSRARRFFAYFCDNLKWGTYVKNLLGREETLSGMESTWKNYFAGAGEDEGP